MTTEAKETPKQSRRVTLAVNQLLKQQAKEKSIRDRANESIKSLGDALLALGYAGQK
jgi:hypothetical protein